MRPLLPAVALMLLAGCPEQVGQQCPANTVPAGQFALGFQGQHPAGECISDAGLDAGEPPYAVTREDGGVSAGAICLGNADGGQQVWLVIPGKGARQSELLADGGFVFTGHSDPVPGTPCDRSPSGQSVGCPVAIDETFSGYLQTSPADAGFTRQPDGGLPLVTSIAGSIVDVYSTDAGTAGCSCALPCGITYQVTGVRQ